MIQNKDRVKDKYKARIDKGKKYQKILKDILKGSTCTNGALYRCGIIIIYKGIWEHKKEKYRQQDYIRRNKTGTCTLHSIEIITWL